MAETAPLFPDLPAPEARPVPRPAYVPRSPRMRVAQHLSRELVRERDGRRKSELYLRMIAAITGKDWVR